MKDSSNLSDIEIIKRVINGDTECFSFLYERHVRYIYGVLRKNLMSISQKNSYFDNIDLDSDTEDLVSLSLEKALKTLHTYDPIKSNFKTWLTTIAVNSFKDTLKKKKPVLLKPIFNEDGEDESPFSYIEKNEPSAMDLIVFNDILNDILSSVNAMTNGLLQCYIIVKFMFLMEDSDIAKLMGVSENAVRSNLTRAIYEFKATFISLNSKYADINIEELAGMVRKGHICTTESQVSGISDPKIRQIITKLSFEKASIDEIALQFDIERDTLIKSIKDVVFDMIKKGIKRKTRKPSLEKELLRLSPKFSTDRKLPAEDVTITSDYINRSLRAIKENTKRGTSRANRIEDITPVIKLLSAVSNRMFGKMSEPVGIAEIITSLTASSKISNDDIVKKLKITPNELSYLLNNRVPYKLGHNKQFLKRLSSLIKVRLSEVVSILQSSDPVSLSGVLRGRGRTDAFERKLKVKLACVLKEKYPRKAKIKK